MVTLACAVSGSRLVVEDIAQDALVKARQHWETIGAYEKPAAWLRRVTIQLFRPGRAQRRRAADLRLAGQAHGQA